MAKLGPLGKLSFGFLVKNQIAEMQSEITMHTHQKKERNKRVAMKWKRRVQKYLSWMDKLYVIYRV